MCGSAMGAAVRRNSTEFPVSRYWRQSRTPAYILDIQMIKTRETAPEKRPLFNATGRAAQVLHYPFSFNLYRVLNKLKLIRSN